MVLFTKSLYLTIKKITEHLNQFTEKGLRKQLGYVQSKLNEQIGGLQNLFEIYILNKIVVILKSNEH